jgi:drug/metabolite transporter (DMT)-like permease
MSESNVTLSTAVETETPRESGPPDRPLLGILLMLLSVALLPIMDGFAKAMSGTFFVAQLVFARFFFQSLVIVPIAVWRNGATLRHLAHFPLQVTRGLCILIATGLFFTAIVTMPIADALALLFVAPLIVTALSPVVLAEPVGVRRWSAVIVGFIGAVVILRPGLGVLQPGAFLALGAGLCFAVYVLLTRKLSHAAPPLVTLSITSVTGMLVTAVIMPFVWITPSAEELAMFIGMGVVGAMGHYLMIRAYEQAPASLLAPFGYGEIVMAVIIGYFWFGDFPDLPTWIGIGILAASGIYISLREGKKRGKV